MGSEALFVARFDAGGQALWTKTVESSEYVHARGVAVDSADNLVIAAGFRGTLEAPFASTSEFWGDSIVFKLDASGDYIWERVIGGPRREEVVAIDVDAADNMRPEANAACSLVTIPAIPAALGNGAP
jgi:hypothetical protein